MNSIQIHKKLRLDKRAGSDNWYARLTLPNDKRLIKTTKTEDAETPKEVASILVMKLILAFKKAAIYNSQVCGCS